MTPSLTIPRFNYMDHLAHPFPTNFIDPAVKSRQQTGRSTVAQGRRNVKALGDGIAFPMHPAHSRLSIRGLPSAAGLEADQTGSNSRSLLGIRSQSCNDRRRERLVFDCLVDKGNSGLRTWAKFGDCFRVGGTKSCRFRAPGADRRADVFTRNHVQDDRAVHPTG